jgi:hypothetical protein
MWDGYDLNVWFAERDERGRRAAYLRLLACLDRASTGLKSFRVGSSISTAPVGRVVEAVENVVGASEGFNSTISAHAEWELWEPHATWPVDQPQWIARRTAPVEHVRVRRNVQALYNVGGGRFMPPRRSGDAYVHLGDGVADDDRYHLWSWRPQAREKRDENRRQFDAFLADVIATVRPAHLLVTPGLFTAHGVHDSLLVFHQDPREFLRDLLRSLFLLEDWLRYSAETPEEEVHEVRVDYMDDAMREPERLVSETMFQDLQARCVEWIRILLSRRPDYFAGSARAALERLGWCPYGPWVGSAIQVRSADEVIEVLTTTELPAFRQVGSGWLVTDRDHPILLDNFFDRLAAAVSVGAFS